MEQKSKEKKKVVNWLKNKFRLLILDDETYEERISFVLSPLSFFVFLMAGSLFMITLVIYIVAFTPLREYIPGYTDVGMRKKIVALSLRADSLAEQLENKDLFIQNINNVIMGKNSEIASDKKQPSESKNKSFISTKPSEDDSILRQEIETKERYSISTNKLANKNEGIKSTFFFTPINGIVTNSFKTSTKHYGIDISAPKNEAIKATLDGTVLVAKWTTETGYTLVIQHTNDIISIYKHCSVLLKKEGNKVNAGEVVAIIGDSGELTSGPHLHFELWYKGSPINPQEYLHF